MILQNTLKFKIKKIKKGYLLSYPGAALIGSLFTKLGLDLSIDKIQGVKKRKRGYKLSEHILSMLCMIISGGESISDIDIINSDEGVKEILGVKTLPSPNTIIELLHKFNQRAVFNLSDINTAVSIKTIEAKKIKSITIDIDSTLIESYKKNAKKSYKGFKAYNPLLAIIAETGSIIKGIFREGNASPSANNLGLLKRIISQLPDTIENVNFRSDSAAYNHEIMNYCQSLGIKFSITCDHTEPLINSIKSIPKLKWKKDEEQDIWYSETVHCVGGDPKQPAYRVVVKRYLLEQPDLFEGHYGYYAVITNNDDDLPEEIIKFHNKRGNAENIIKENKYGYALTKIPCEKLMANAAFFQINLLAYNLVQLFKIIALPKTWFSYTIKNLRFRLFNICGYVSKRSRYLWINFSEQFKNFQIFEEAKYNILAHQFT